LFFPISTHKFTREKLAEPPTLSTERYPGKIPDKKRITHAATYVKRQNFIYSLQVYRMAAGAFF
jgi:hypothetical protein